MLGVDIIGHLADSVTYGGNHIRDTDVLLPALLRISVLHCIWDASVSIRIPVQTGVPQLESTLFALLLLLRPRIVQPDSLVTLSPLFLALVLKHHLHVWLL